MTKQYTRQVTERFLDASEKIIANEHLRQVEFSESIGLPASNLIRMKTKPDNNVPIETLCQIIHTYSVSPVWLLTGAGDMFSNSQITASAEVIISRLPEIEAGITDIQKSLKLIKKGIKASGTSQPQVNHSKN